MQYSSEDVKYMKMALRYAAKGIGKVEPNPAVGCLITKSNQIIGKGFHQKFGQAHAEINALDDCKNLGVKPIGSTMYVTLEPCCHYGKTGPCTEAIINAGVARVIVATLDTSPHASGAGIEKLKQAGIEVSVGLCQLEANLLNAGFLKHAKTKRPWVILKWAQSIDGKLAWVDGSAQRWISNEQSRADSHNLRRSCTAIIVGVNTVIKDNPLLTPRPAKGKSPLRIVLDNNLRIPLGSRILNTKDKTMIVSTARAVDAQPEKAERIRAKDVEILTVPEIDGNCYVEAILDELGKRDIQQILVEGGPTVINSFLKSAQADEAVIYIAGKMLGKNGDVDIETAMIGIPEPMELFHMSVQHFENDCRIKGTIRDMNFF